MNISKAQSSGLASTLSISPLVVQPYSNLNHSPFPGLKSFLQPPNPHAPTSLVKIHLKVFPISYWESAPTNTINKYVGLDSHWAPPNLLNFTSQTSRDP